MIPSVDTSHWQECYKGPKYSMDTDEENGTYTLTIKNPKMEDGGRYTCIVRECNDLSCKGYLEVERKSAVANWTWSKNCPCSRGP